MKRDPLLLDKQVCFALYTASRAVTGLYRPMLDELGLTYPQYLVMLVLWERRSISVKELGAALQLDSGTLSPLLKRMEANGLLARRRRRDDERSVDVELTSHGAGLRARARSIPERLVSALGLSHDELVTLRDISRRVATTALNQTTVNGATT